MVKKRESQLMKNFILILALFSISKLSFGACSTPISRGGTFSPNTSISSTAMNTQLNTLYTAVNEISGDCLTTGTVAKAKLATGYKDQTITSISAIYTALSTDEFIKASASGAAFTITIPTAVGITGRTYTITKTDTSVNIVTIDPVSSETINGVATFDLFLRGQSITIVSDGSNWWIQ
jgi:hypothetical protein